MNRRIKFRIWNNKTKKWIHGPHEQPDLDGVNLFGETILFGALLDGVSIENLNDIVALQFTGIQDKNGKDIFEGDIIRQASLPGSGVIEEIITVATWKDENCGFYLKRIKGFGFASEKKGLEVIGNIFDNPELLCEKEN